MPRLVDLTTTIRAKNAGPFWVTIDLFFADQKTYSQTSSALQTDTVASRLGLKSVELKRFDLNDIRVIKFSFPRPVVQGDRRDRDMHGAQYAWLLNDLTVDD